MEDLTLLMLIACVAYGGAVFLYRKADSRAYSLAMVLSVVAVGAVVTDPAFVGSPGPSLALGIVAPITVMISSIGGMLLGRRARWRRASRPP
ncbi:MAG: hypothetical protein J6Z16_05250, partial [Candidatus Methanomethylophilaceae archaeon]|nr:hypothetical protein [Candidatus Methanomethylophilaceae archaeon]